MIPLRQSTARTIKLGPFLDETDGVTAETGLTISQADVRLSKNGGDMAQKNESSSATHDELGYYDVALNATDTNTVGDLRVMVTESGALPVFRDFQVVTERKWLALQGVEFTPSGGRVYVVEASGGNASGYMTKDDPGTLAAAIAAASHGDTISLAAGTYTFGVDEQADLSSLSHVTLMGDSADTTSLVGTDAAFVATLGDYCRLLYLTLDNTASGNDFAAVLGNGATGCEIGYCVLRGTGDALFGNAMTNAWIHHTTATGTWDAVVGLADRCLIEFCDFATDGTNVGTTNSVALALGDACTVRNTKLTATRASATSSKVRGLSVSGDCLVESCEIIATQSNATSTGDAIGIESLAGATVTVLGGRQVVTNAGAGAATKIDATATGADKIDFGTVPEEVLATFNADSDYIALKSNVAGIGPSLVTIDSKTSDAKAASESADTKLSTARLAKVDNLPAAGTVATATNVTDSRDSILNKLLAYFRLALRKDAATATDQAAELAEINADAGSGAGAYNNATDSAEAVRDRGDSDWATGTGGNGATLLETTIATVTSQTVLVLTDGSPDNDAYNGRQVVITDQSTSTQKAVGVVADYVGSSKTLTLQSAPGFTVVAGDVVVIETAAASAVSLVPAVGRLPKKARRRTLTSRADGLVFDNPYIDLMPGEQGAFLVALEDWGDAGQPPDGFTVPVSGSPSVVEVLANPSDQPGRYWGVCPLGVVFTLKAPSAASVGASTTLTLGITDDDDSLPPQLTVRIISPAAVAS